jgi:PAS domain S-box-containing protein
MSEKGKKGAKKGAEGAADSGEKGTTESTQQNELVEAFEGNGQPFPVVGIGSSAGGLEALKKFLTATPPDTGMAFVLIQHLDPTHESLMVDLLARYTTMKVVQIENDMPVEPNRIHIIPPGTSLTIRNGVLLLGKPIERRGMRMPVDNFFISLAEDQQENAVCIILSGTGSDGTLGLKEIKARGGLAMVQAPETAQYDGMPRSAIMTGLVDYVLPVEQIPSTLVGYIRHSLTLGRLAEPLLTEAEEKLHRILTLLHVRTGHDFRYYKKNTLVRRLQRRMTVNHITELGGYLDLIQNHPEELESFDKDLLISVTMFFREPEVWEALQETVVPKLIERCTEKQPVRIWVPGCATGEEAYSLAMMLIEEGEKRKRECPVQIYATDIDKEALETGRRGAYPENITEQVSHERLTRFFTRDANGMYQVIKRIREMVVFAPQNLISDPPFSKLDMVSCRNVLIYIQTELQKKIVTLFHFALRDEGYLVLGNSESVGQRTDLFEPVSKRCRIYRQISSVTRSPLDLPLGLDLGRRPGDIMYKPAVPLAVRYADIAKGQLIQKFTPPSVLINNHHETLFFSGVTRDFLSLPEGAPTDNIIDMADPALRPKLRTALHKAETEKREVVLGGIRLSHGGGATVRLTVAPVKGGNGDAGLFLVSFEYEPRKEPLAALNQEEISEESVIRSLEEELKRSREELQATIEQMETSNEELKASNEEVMSMNEELQSSNEELETSREELQSLNEELSTLNSQLQDKVAELEVTTDDLNNLLTSTNIATIFMSEDFRIKRYTPAATQLLNLIPGDIGRPLKDITRRFSDDSLFEDAVSVLRRLAPMGKEIESDDGKWFMRRILPYRTQDNRIEGVVVTFTDISDIKQAEERSARLASFPQLNPHPIVEVDASGEIIFVNPAAQGILEKLGMNKGNATVFLPSDLPSILRNWEGKSMTTMYREVAVKDRILGETIHLEPIFNVIRIYAIDITERKNAEDALRASEQRLARAQEIAHFGSWELDLPSNTLAWSDEVYRIFGLQPKEFAATYEAFLEAVHPDDRAAVDAAYSASVSEGKDSYEIEHRVVRKSTGEVRIVHEKCEHWRDASGRVIRSVGMVHDITERKKAEEAVTRAAETAQMQAAQLEAIMKAVPAALLISHDPICSVITGNPAAYELLRMPPGSNTSKSNPEARVDHFKVFHANREVTPGELPVQRAAATGNPVHDYEERIVFNDGDDVWVYGNAVPLRGGDGRPAGAVAAFIDVTERKKAEERLRESEERFRTLTETSPDCIALHDRDLRHLYVNPAISRLANLPQEAFVGKTVFEVGLPEDFAAQLDRMLRETRDTGREYLGDLTFNHSSGVSYFNWHSVPVLAGDGSLVAIMTISHDITERKKSDEEIKRLNKSLGRQNAELESSNRELQAFVYSVSHDLRAPLRTMSGFVKFLSDDYADRFDERGRDYLTRIGRGSAKLTRIIDDLLNLSRISRQKASRTKVDLNALASSVIAALCESEPERGVDVSIQQGLTASADATLMELVLTNLLGNAWKFTSKKEHARIEFGSIEKDGVPLFYVKDNGAGFDQQHKEQMFLPFHRLHSEKDFEGTGIGLAIVERIIRIHGGRVWAEGEVDKGVAVYFTVGEH